MISGPVHHQRAARALNNSLRIDHAVNGWDEWGYVAAVPGSGAIAGTVDLYLNGTQALSDTSYLVKNVRCLASYPYPVVGDTVYVAHSGGNRSSDRVVVGPALKGGGDTGWLTMTLTSPWTTAGVSCLYRRSGNLVRLAGQIKGATSGSFWTPPSGFAPAGVTSWGFPAVWFGGVGLASWTGSAWEMLDIGSTTDSVYLSNIAYTLD